MTAWRAETGVSDAGASAELSCTAALLANPAERGGERALSRVLAAMQLGRQWAIRFTQGKRRDRSAASSAAGARPAPLAYFSSC